MTQVDQHTDAHRERTAVDIAAHYKKLNRSSAEAAIVGTDGDRLANAMLARTDLSPEQVNFWTAFADIIGNQAVELPAPPTPSPAAPIKRLSPKLNAPIPTTIPGLLNADEVAELKPLAEGVSLADAEQALAYLEMTEAAGAHFDMGVTKEEEAAARLLRDDRRYRAALRNVGDEVRASAKRLDDFGRSAA